MKRLLLIVPLALVACDIRSDRPGYRYPAASNPSGTDYPELAVTAELLNAGAVLKEDAETRARETERLIAQARALRARAARLRAETR